VLPVPMPKTGKSDKSDKSDYRSALQANLHSFVLPVDALLCREVLCCDTEHQCMLNKLLVKSPVPV